MTETKNDFSKGSILSNMISLAVPMTLAQLVNVLYNIIDRIYIGRIGEDATLALTALGVCLPLITMVTAFANLIGMGGAPLFSIERGAGRRDEAESILGNSFTLIIIFGVALTVLGMIFKKPLLTLLGASADTLPYAVSYITIYFLGNIFVMMTLGLNSFINAEGFGKIGMLTVVIGAALNIALDPLFIFVFHMGVSGAAAATVISQFVSALWTFRFLRSDNADIKINFTKLRLASRRVKKILALGLSGFTMAVTNSLVSMTCNASLQRYGGDLYIGAMTIINSVREIFSMPVMGLSNSAQPIIGYNYGAGEYSRVKQAIRYMSVILIVYTAAAWAVISLFPRFFIGMFSDDAALMNVGVPSMHIYFFGFFMMALQFAGQSTFTALGRSKQAVFFSIFRKVIIVIPLTLLLPLALGVNGVFTAEPISNFIGGAACFAAMMLTVYKTLPDDGESGKKKIRGDFLKKIPWTEIGVAVVIAVLAGFIVSKSFGAVVENGDKKECKSMMKRIASEIQVRIDDDREGGFWLDLVNTGSSESILTAVKQKIGDQTMDISDYKIERGEKKLTVSSTKYEKLEETIKMPEYIRPPAGVTRRAERLSVSGPSEYRVNASLDANDPSKMRFANGDDLKRIFSGVSVALIYSDGEKRKLAPDEYTMITGGIDMTKTGEKSIIVSYNNPDEWGGVQNTVYSFNVTQSGGRLEIDFGDFGKYTIASWKWQDYVDEAAEDEGKIFDASIVEFEDEFYYYPDGFTIINSHKNQNPLKSARDTEDSGKTAYCIKMDPSSAIVDKNGAAPENGSFMLEDNQIYIWQEQPSRDADAGWLRVYGMTTKL